MEAVEQPMSADRAETEILAIRDLVAGQGANDYEIPTINGILERLKSGKLTPDEALVEAHAINNRKASYH